MIATVSPGASSADHTLNTLRYADRIKEQKVGSKSSKFKSQNIENKAPTTNQAEDKLPEKGRTGVLTNSNDETELELAVQRVFEEEEDLLNTHMSHISESAQLLTEEGKMLQTIQQESVTEEQIEDYVRRLEEIIERKTQLIEDLDEKMASFRQSLKVEEELSSKLVR
jgi:kinesin family protein 2/24